MTPLPFDAINAAALAILPQLLEERFPAGRRRGREFLIGDIQGAPGESLSINVDTGKWSDFARSEPGGPDPISIFAAADHGGDRVAAAKALGRRTSVYLNGKAPGPRAEINLETKPEEEWRPQLPAPSEPPELDRAPKWHGRSATLRSVYRDASGAPLFVVYRYPDPEKEGAKDDIPYSYGRRAWTDRTGMRRDRTGWHFKRPPAPLPLYRLDRLDKTLPVLVVEGERKADIAARRFPGMSVVTSQGGSNNAKATDWSQIIGLPATIWPDHDAAGMDYARDVAAMLGTQSARCVQIPADWPEGWDLADEPPDGADLDAMLRAATLMHQGRTNGNGADHAQTKGSEERPSNRSAKAAVTKPRIIVEPGRVDETATEGEHALAASGLPVFQRDKKLVRPAHREVSAAHGRTVTAACLHEITCTAMIDYLSRAASWAKEDHRAKRLRPCDPPKLVADIVLTRAGEWTVPSIAGIITSPTLRPDGSIISKPGYDPDTRLFYVEDSNLKLPPLQDKPTKSDAEAALRSLCDLLKDFPFIGEVDRSVALSGLLTSVARGALGVVPMHGFRAFAASSGKSYLVDLISTVSTGRPCPVASASTNPEETEKRLIGLVLSGVPLISLDNVNGDLGGDTLCQVIERPLLSLRPLGGSGIIEIENRATLFATGNNMRGRGDMNRRLLLSRLDPRMERPELRKFDSSPIEIVMGNRGRYVAACLTIVRAYLAAGFPISLPPIASFGEWSKLIRDPLVWLGLPDPADSIESVREDDPDLGEVRELFGLWREHLGVDARYRVGALIEAAESRTIDPEMGHTGSDYRLPELREALVRIAGERGSISAARLGIWLRDHKGRIADGARLDSEGNGKKPAKWFLDAGGGSGGSGGMFQPTRGNLSSERERIVCNSHKDGAEHPPSSPPSPPPQAGEESQDRLREIEKLIVEEAHAALGAELATEWLARADLPALAAAHEAGRPYQDAIADEALRIGERKARVAKAKAERERNADELLRLAVRKFGSTERARVWLTTRHPRLGHQVPAEVCGNPGDMKRCEGLLQ